MRTTRRRRPIVRTRLRCESLEARAVPANVLTYHNDPASTGVNSNETTLTRANVNSTQFGKIWQAQVTGQVYAEPLVMQNVNITTGSNQGNHDVVFVATEHDQLYAYDAANGTQGVLLWQRNFLDLTNANNHLPNATALTSVPQADVNTSDITVEIGITGTPVIDANAGALYLITKTKETVSGVAHWVQRLHKINVQNGADMVTPFLVGDTTGSNSNNTQIYVYGSGSGHVTDPYNGTGQQVVQFNALREHQRPALTLVNGVVYTGWASHGDNGPYHGWMVGFDAGDLHLRGVLNTTPNGGLGGIWMAGGALTFDGTYFYFETGNGTFDGSNGSGTGSNTQDPPGAPGPVMGLNAQGFPSSGDYGDSFVKVALDPTTTPQSQNINGWGLKVQDYFTPLNQAYLNATDLDVGSSACVVVPNSYGSTAHPHLLIGSGKEGVIYLIDRDNMGKFGQHNNIVQNTNNQLNGSLDSAAIFNGRLYYVEGYGGVAKTFTFANAAFSMTPETQSADSFAFAGSTPAVTANGTSNGIVWDIDRGTNQLRAYSTDSYGTELYTSADANGRDALGAAVKFQVVTAANGHVFCGSGTGDPNNYLVVYGLLAPPNNVPNAPSNLAAQPVSSSQINLTFTDNAVTPNTADGFYIEQSPNGTTGWTQIAISSATSYPVTGLNPATTYFFRVRAHDSLGFSAYSNIASATTNNSSGHSIDFDSGFTGGASSFTFNGYGTSTPIQANGNLQLTSATGGLARSALYNTPQNIVTFSTSFTYTKNGSADGATFVIETDPRGLTALGGAGGSLAYGSANQITPSFALAINIYAGHAQGTEFVTNGNLDFNYSQTNIDTSLDNAPIRVDMSYAGGFLSATLTQGNNTETKTLSIDLPTLLGSNTAYVGFTGATGGANALQEITRWTFDQGLPPSAVTGLQGQITGYTATSTQAVPLGVHLTWNATPGAVSYKIERKLTAGGTYQQIGTSATPSFDDSGLTPGSNYFYHVRATNAVGDGAFSPDLPITTPSLAPTPNGSQVTGVTTTSISFRWTDNANNEDGFQIFRSVNAGTFSLLIALPANTVPAPSMVTFTDTNLVAGNRYDYHILAFNLAGYSDFAGITTQTLTTAPTSVTAAAATGAIALNWTAPNGATSFNIYRGTSPGGEGVTPFVTGVTGTSYSDAAIVSTNTYYYRISAVDLGGESALSSEVFVAPARVSSVQIDDGSAQRSRVASITVTFNTLVNVSASSFSIAGFAGTINVDTSLSTATQTIARLTFSGGGVVGGSLADGNYTLTILGSQVTDLSGQLLDGDGDGQPGGNSTTNFFRFFGDVNGDRTVNGLDLGFFRDAFGTQIGDGNYLSYLDYDGDGVINGLDLGQFRTRFGTMLP